MVVHDCPGSGVTFFARHRRMFSQQRILCCRVRPHVESGARKAIHGVTRPAIAAVHPLRKLAVMLVRMTVEALVCRDWSFEIRTLVARGALHGGVLSSERVTRPGVVKALQQRCPRDFPSRCGMTCPTTGCESSTVRVAMASRALGKVQALIASRVSRFCMVAILAGNFRV